MDFENRHHSDGENNYDGAIQQITPGPVGSSFVPELAIGFAKPPEITIRRTPQRKQKLA